MFRNLLLIRHHIPRLEQIVLGIVPILTILLLWFFSTLGEAEVRWVSPTILPSPIEVIRSFPSLWFQSELSRSVILSFTRVITGFIVSLLVAFPLGILMGSFTRVRALFDSLATFGAYLPIPALVPLTMSIFGIGELQKIMFLALAFFVYLLPLFVKAVDEVDNVYLQTAYSLGARKWQVVRHILLGISFPQLYHAIRLGFGIGWTYIIIAEMVAADRGLGYIITIAQRRGPREHIYLVLVVIVVIAFVTDRILVKLGEILFPYQEQKS